MSGDRLSSLRAMVAEKLADIRAAKAAGVPFKPATRRPRPTAPATEQEEG